MKFKFKIQDYQTEAVDAVVKACNDDQSTTFETSEAFTLGVAINGSLNSNSLSLKLLFIRISKESFSISQK